MKLIIKIGLLIILVLGLVGCGETYHDSKYEDNPNAEQSQNRFQPTGKYYSINDGKFNEILDTETGDLYLSNKTKTYGDYYVTNLIPFLKKDKPIQQTK
jgi:hypothetical protein